MHVKGAGSLTTEEATCLRLCGRKGLGNMRNREKANITALKGTRRGEEEKEAGEGGRGQIKHGPVCHDKDIGLHLKTTASH